MLAILKWLTGGVIENVTDKLANAYEAKLKAETDSEKLQADITISQLEARQRYVHSLLSQLSSMYGRLSYMTPYCNWV